MGSYYVRDCPRWSKLQKMIRFLECFYESMHQTTYFAVEEEEEENRSITLLQYDEKSRHRRG